MKPRAADDLDRKPVDDKLLVYDPRTGRVHVLNAAAADVLDWCDGTRDLDALAATLAAAARIDAATAAADVRAIVDAFIAQGLVRAA